MIEDESCVRNNIYRSAESNFNYRKLTKEGIGLLAEGNWPCKGQNGG